MSKNKPRSPRKIPVIKPSKYELSAMSSVNKKYWNQVFEEQITSTAEDDERKKMADALPEDLYEKVCHTLNIPRSSGYTEKTQAAKEQKSRRTIKQPMLSFRKALLIDRELDSDTDVETSPRVDEVETYNIHQELLRKPEREQITWDTHYLLPEKEDEKSLVRKADDLTNRIAQNFCEYMTQLGGNQQSQLFTPKAIKELFQIEFDTHVARSLRVIPKELPSVDDKLAQVTENPDKSRYAVLEREVLKDMRADERADHVKAFNRSVPRADQWHAPDNRTADLWRSARYVPKDLVTLKAVWEGITHLRSVKEYCRWMVEHPEHRRAPYLSSLGLFDPAVLDARLTTDAGHRGHLNSGTSDLDPIDDIRRKLSELADVGAVNITDI